MNTLPHWWPPKRDAGEILDPRPANPAPASLSYILQLPDEILSDAFDYLVGNDAMWRHTWSPCSVEMDTVTDLLALMFTCRRFLPIADRLLYRSISIHLVPWSSVSRTFRFYDCLKAHPDRIKYCRELELNQYCRNPSPHDLDTLWTSDSILSALSNVRKLELTWWTTGTVWDTYARISRYMPRLEYLHVMSPCGSSGVVSLINKSELPDLKTLKLDDTHRGAGASEPIGIDRDKLQKSSVTTLDLGYCVVYPEPLTSLIQWPHALETFVFHPMANSTHDLPQDYMNFDMLFKMLLPHENSLRRVELGLLEMKQPEDSVFQASRFTNLEHLQFMEHNLSCEPEVAAEALFGGSLQTLVLDCFIGHCLQNPTITPQRTEWLEDFVREVGRLPASSPAKRKIILEGTGEKWFDCQYPEMKSYPRTLIECLDTVQEIATEVGIDFSYVTGADFNEWYTLNGNDFAYSPS
ncbi:hypothetical protein M426DRAFT_182454 [Hypoxylon sp. CI-4A]|nr:hypothetical protein M426DRAFT_182454 [Hypoxylon sp. CI-4A]